MTTDGSLAAPDPLALLCDLLDAAAVEARARAEDATSLDQGEVALDHQRAIEDAASYLLGGDPTPNWLPYTEAVTPMQSPSEGWHLHTTADTTRYLATLSSERDGGANLDGLLYRLTRDQRDLAHRLLHPEEVTGRFGLHIEQIRHLIARSAIPHCTISGITWVVETDDLEATIQARPLGDKR